MLQAHCIMGTIDGRGGGGGGGGGEPIPLLSPPYPLDYKKFTAWLAERVFQSSEGETQSQSHVLLATFCIS